MPLKIGIVGSERQCLLLLDLLADQDELGVCAALPLPQEPLAAKRFGAHRALVAASWEDFVARGPEAVFSFLPPSDLPPDWPPAGVELVSYHTTHAVSSLLSLLSRQLNQCEEQRVKYLSALNSVTEGIQIMNEAGIIEYINPAFSKITGIHPAERIGTNVFQVSPDGAAARVLMSGKAATGVRNQAVGSCADVISNGAPIFMAGTLRGAVVAFQEVTDIIRLSEELSTTKELVESLSRELGAAKYSFADMIGANRKLLAAINLSKRAAKNDSTVLITGESGTGKEIVANAIHHASPRWNKPFITVNCASIPEALLESELFGHEKGAFTGAHKAKAGKFELANGGTIFLDEIGDLSSNTQAKLLRVLQEKEVERIGSNHRQAVNVKILAATNRNLQSMVAEGLFRQDLYYRLQVINVTLPPLRERKDDIPLLVDHFLRRICQESGRSSLQMAETCLELLLAHSWPGNVRELQNVLTRAVTICDGDALLPGNFRFLSSGAAPETVPGEEPILPLHEMEKAMVVRALRKYGWSTAGKRSAARELGIALGTLYYKIKQYQLGK
ncbi:sigma-54 interaction domain-containing protein [Anaeroselena agilis]|uniref:Sigma 54-interacting transcriptional regulator n=1 Tax=Anaeroselena agilis TaxID=3063788 RepID=A0ABU3P088_9FIRM|nr:sigma 54-interacting transcriptional regulator [Selenomonadales bacterium 4137-cl]